MFNHLSYYFRRINQGYYNYLLIFLIILFAFRPYDRGFEYLSLWKSLFTCTILTAIFNCKHHDRVKITAIILAVPTFIFGWVELFYTNPTFFVVNMLFTIAFLWVCTASILYDVILHAKVTVETLRGVVCAYFMIAFLFAYTYYLIEFLLPGSFHFITRDASFFTFSSNLSQLMYFSFVTLLTIGYGDITPLGDISQTIVILEGIVGQFYIAILVARIVSVYAFYADKKLLKQAIQGIERKKTKR
ncbi:MAG: hypothetical protein JSS60_00135 [Verrucomicrobia bacterium]|nr:hypothetical protein [Verrucomicrobiota bacterium]